MSLGFSSSEGDSDGGSFVNPNFIVRYRCYNRWGGSITLSEGMHV